MGEAVAIALDGDPGLADSFLPSAGLHEGGTPGGERLGQQRFLFAFKGIRGMIILPAGEVFFPHAN
jgi:hypothetical protein